MRRCFRFPRPVFSVPAFRAFRSPVFLVFASGVFGSRVGCAVIPCEMVGVLCCRGTTRKNFCKDTNKHEPPKATTTTTTTTAH